MLHFDEIVFGPIYSRRLGSSLGVSARFDSLGVSLADNDVSTAVVSMTASGISWFISDSATSANVSSISISSG